MSRKHYRPFFVRGIRKRYLKIMQGGKEQAGRFGRQFFLRVTLSPYVKFAIDDFQIEREMLGMILPFQFSAMGGQRVFFFSHGLPSFLFTFLLFSLFSLFSTCFSFLLCSSILCFFACFIFMCSFPWLDWAIPRLHLCLALYL